MITRQFCSRRKGAAAVAAVSAVAAVHDGDKSDSGSHKNVTAVSNPGADDDEIQDYASAYKKSQVVVEKILKVRWRTKKWFSFSF